MKNVAIVGSGPAGLSCAHSLVEVGVNVTVFDELIEFGGMLAYGVPEFRIPLKIVQEKIGGAKKVGIKFVQKKVTSINSLLKEYDFVVLAIGSGDGLKVDLGCSDKVKIIDALEFLKKDKLEKKKLVSPEDNVAVIGGGNSAMDSARVALRQGAKVSILYRRTENEMPAIKSEIENAKKQGVEFNFLLAPNNFDSKLNKLTCKEMILSGEDSSGRKTPIDSGKTQLMSFTKIILAVGQEPDFSWLTNEGIKLNGKVIFVDENNLTSLPRVYACGDCVTGPKTIATATVSGIKTANSIKSLLN